MPAPDLEIREYDPTRDESFVYRTWLDCLRATGPMVKRVRDCVFFRYYRCIIRGIIERPTTRVLVAAQADSPVIYGCFVHEPAVCMDDRRGVAHWIYTKGPWRREGVATALIAASGVDMNAVYYTHQTTYDLGLNVRGRVGHTPSWQAVREARVALATELEAKDRAEGDTRVLLAKWPGMTYNPFLIGRW